jgi:hypothetical protein
MLRVIYQSSDPLLNDKERKQAEKDKCYIMRDRCNNCDAIMYLAISKGITKDKAIEKAKVKCANCGCNPFEENMVGWGDTA